VYFLYGFHSASGMFAPSDPGCALPSIKAILQALNSAGCTACAARLVALRELGKYGKEASK